MISSHKFFILIASFITPCILVNTILIDSKAGAAPSPSPPEAFVPISEKHQECSASDLQRFENENRRIMDAYCAKIKKAPGIFYLAFPGRNGSTIYCETPFVSEKPVTSGGNAGLMLMPFAFSCEAQEMYLKSVKESEDWYKKLCADRKKCRPPVEPGKQMQKTQKVK